MADSPDSYERALKTIRSADLAHPDAPLVESFLEHATDPECAASYILQRAPGNGRQVSGLAEVLQEWKSLLWDVAHHLEQLSCAEVKDNNIVERISGRDGGRCCLTGLQGDPADPLIVVPIMPKFEIGADISGILTAFLGKALFNSMCKACAPSEYGHDGLENYWLVQRSAAVAFAQGYFQISFGKRNKYEIQVNLVSGPHLPAVFKDFQDFRQARFKDHTASDMPTPSQQVIEVLSRLSVPIRWSLIGQEISNRREDRGARQVAIRPTWPVCSSLFQIPTAVLAAAWRQLPSFIRTWTYSLLASLGRRTFGPSASLSVQRLPFGLYLKTCQRGNLPALQNEATALRLVREHTEIPLPRVMDLVHDSQDAYLLTTRIPGFPLGQCMDVMSDEELEVLGEDLQAHLSAIRAIQRPPHYASISSATGGACFDYRIITALSSDDRQSSDFIGPFDSESDFNSRLSCGAIPDVIRNVGHDVVFTHGDLNMRNIIMDVCADSGFRLSGIVDWENSGWYPEYWEYTKAHFVTRLHSRF